jgi:hypothetical protein
MSDRPAVPQFRPIRRQLPPARLITLAVVSPLLWLAAFVLASIVLDETNAIELGLVVASVSFVAGLIGLSLLRAARRRKERRHADGR